MNTTSRILLISSILIIMSFLISSCGDAIKPKDNDEGITFTPGRLTLVKIDGIGKTLIETFEATDEDTILFILGDLKASRDFYFFLKNTGGTAITDITIESNNAHFDVTPEEIGILEPDSLATIIPIIRVSALHGVALNGIGYIDLIPMNENRTVISIAGVTTDENGTNIPVSLFAELTINALIMDIELFDGDSIIDLTTPDGSGSSNLGGLGFIRYYNYSLVPKINNIGNISMTVSVYYEDIDKYFLGSIEPDDTLIVDFPEQPNDTLGAERSFGLIELDGDNTITDNDRLQLGNNGRAYFYLFKSE